MGRIIQALKENVDEPVILDAALDLLKLAAILEDRFDELGTVKTAFLAYSWDRWWKDNMSEVRNSLQGLKKLVPK